MATSDGKRLISTISQKKIGDCEQSKFALGQNKNASFGNTKSFNSSSLFYIPWWEYYVWESNEICAFKFFKVE